MYVDVYILFRVYMYVKRYVCAKPVYAKVRIHVSYVYSCVYVQLYVHIYELQPIFPVQPKDTDATQSL